MKYEYVTKNIEAEKEIISLVIKDILEMRDDLLHKKEAFVKSLTTTDIKEFLFEKAIFNFIFECNKMGLRLKLDEFERLMKIYRINYQILRAIKEGLHFKKFDNCDLDKLKICLKNAFLRKLLGTLFDKDEMKIIVSWDKK